MLPMPLSPEEFYAHALSHADGEGRLAVPDVASRDVWPFEANGLRVVPLRPPALPDSPRGGEGGRACWSCDPKEPAVWSDQRWRLQVQGEGGAPLVLMLTPHAHHDLIDLPDVLAAELGLLQVRIARAVEALPHIGRCHVLRIGDGGSHLHVFFYARPEGFPQLLGSVFAVWDDILPPVPADVRAADAAVVARTLVASQAAQPRPRPTRDLD